MKTHFDCTRAAFAALCLLVFACIAPLHVHGATVTGHAYLQGQTNNSGIHVTFTALTPSAHTDSTVTDLTGLYTITLANGYYSGIFTRAGFYSSSYPDTIVVAGTDSLLNDTLQLIPGVTLSGNISGTLYPGIQYFARGNLVVPAESTLTILPGTIVQFDSGIGLAGPGHIIARGTINDSIIFTTSRVSPTPAYWTGINVPDSDYQNTFAFCRIEYSGGIILSWYSRTKIDSCMFENNNLGVNLWGSWARIIGNTFQRNALAINAFSAQYVVNFEESQFAPVEDVSLIEGNTFSANAQALQLIGTETKVISNVFRDFAGYGIVVSPSGQFPPLTSDPLVKNNLFQRINGVAIEGSDVMVITGDTLEDIFGDGVLLAGGSMEIDSCTIANDTGCGIRSFIGFATITQNTIHDCDSGISVNGAIIEHNVVFRTGRALIRETSGCTINSNTVSEAEFGLTLAGEAGAVIEENAITYCQTGIITDNSLDDSKFDYNALFGNVVTASGSVPLGFGQKILVNSTGDSVDTYADVFNNPLYADTAQGNFHLLSNSPLINAGDPSLPKDPDSTIADIGAFYHDKSILAVHLRSSSVPRQFALEQNYPNPFNPSTTINYALPKESFVRLTIYNVLGQEVRTLTNETEQAGYKSAVFDGSSLASGVYFYRIVAGAFTDVKKMILIK